MNLRLESLIAIRYLRSKNKEKFISLISIFSFLGITLGVATLIIVMSVMNGFRYEFIKRIIGMNSHLTITSNNGIENYLDIVNDIKNVSNQVIFINPIVESESMISANNKAGAVFARGILQEDLNNKFLISNNITSGAISNILPNSIVIGSVLASNLGVSVGEEVKIISIKTNETIIGTIPRIKTYVISAIFDSGMHEYDASIVFLPFYTSQIHFKQKNKSSYIEVFINEADNDNVLNKTKYQIIKTLNNKYSNDYQIFTWKEINGSFINALKIERSAMFLILILIIVVASFNIISSMIMLVNDKNKNIAYLRTMGMTKGAVMRIFIMCGSTIGIVGTLFGTIFGVMFSINISNIKNWIEKISEQKIFDPAIYFLSNLPSKIVTGNVITIVLISLFLSFLATIYPAYKASKSDPIDLLRYE